MGNIEKYQSKSTIQQAVTVTILPEMAYDKQILGRDKMATIFQTIFSYAFSWMKIYEFAYDLLKFVPKVSINNFPALVQILPCRRPDDKSFFEPMMASLPTHLCIIPAQCVAYLFWRFDGMSDILLVNTDLPYGRSLSGDSTSGQPEASFVHWWLLISILT